MKPFIALLCALFIGCFSFKTEAQSFKKTYKRYQKGRVEGAAAVFEKYTRHKKYGAPARYYVAALRLPDKRALADLLRANRELIEQDSAVRALSPKRASRLKRKYQVDTTAIAELRLQTQRWAIAYVRVNGSLEALDSLLEQLEAPFPIVQADLQNTRSDIVHAHLDDEDYDQITRIMKKHLRVVRTEHYPRSRRMYDRLWPAFTAKYPACQLDRFAEDHPGSFVGRDCWRDAAREALCSDDLARLLDFHARVPWTALETPILSAIAALKADSAQLRQLSPDQLKRLEDLRLRNQARNRLSNGIAPRDSALIRQQVENYVRAYAPRYSAFKLMEDALQVFLEQQLYGTASLMLETLLPYFPDTLPAPCETNFDFQRRVQPWIKGKLPILQRPPDGLSAQPLEALNTEQGDEANPVLSADGKELYFSAAGRPENEYPGPDVFVSRRTVEGSWNAPRSVPALSGKEAQIPLSITADGSEMLAQVDGRLAISRRNKTTGEWEAPTPVPLSGIAMIGRGFLSADGKAIVLEGAYSAGGILTAPDVDLFVSFREADGAWSRPAALGSDINTDENEGNPWLSPDNQTLYYTSNGYPGLGRSDVFVARRKKKEWTIWSYPLNLGKEINDTFGHKGFGGVSADGRRAVLARYLRDSAKGDLWETDLPRLVE